MKYIAASLLSVFLSGLLSVSVYAGPAGSIVEKDTNRILSIVSDPLMSGDANKEKRRSSMREVLEKRFDFTEMSKRALGKEWKKRSEEEKKEFVDLFKTLLEDTYIEKMEMYNNQKINMGKEEEMEPGKFSIETFITMESGDIPIIYKMIARENDWMVYDVVIEGVGLIQNYRTQFKKILDEQNYDALIKKLKEKNK